MEGVAEDISDPSQELSDDSDDELDEFDHLGLEAINKACMILYPDQPNPFQVVAVNKIWLGGPNPLDFITIYQNEGVGELGVPAHWHFVSHGFSDLYGDGRVHEFSGKGLPSGFGFELTMRVRRRDDELTPPLWPTQVLNKLAKYVFQTGNVLHIGDHIPWHRPLDGGQSSQIKHMLVTEDAQLVSLDTPYGLVDFRQLIGVTDDEVKAAQRWRGLGVLEMLAKSPEVGPFFITNLEREKSIFEQHPHLVPLISEGIEKEGSNLGHVTALCSWKTLQPSEECCGGLETDTCTGMDDRVDDREADEEEEEEEEENSWPIITHDSVHLFFDAEAAELLPMVVWARLKKGRFFTFHNAANESICFVPPTDSKACLSVSEAEPIRSQGPNIQIYCSQDFIQELQQELDCLHEIAKRPDFCPKEFRFSRPTVTMTVTEQGKLAKEAV